MGRLGRRARAVPLALEAARWGTGTWLLARVPLLSPADPAPVAGASVAVVVPARDEAANLAKLLGSLSAQTRPADQVIVVDDGSRDATAEVAGELGAKVVPAGPLPQGWAGKPWACATGAQVADTDLLVFLDADTELAPDGLERLVAAHWSMGERGLLSVAPEHVTLAPYERLSALCNVVAMMGTGAFTPLGRWGRSVGAFGPCLVTSRVDYGRAGGHGAVRDQVVDDLALAERYRGAGLPVRLFGGRGTVSFRMYPSGLAQLAEGWAKNLASGAGAIRPTTLVLVVAWLSGLLAAPWSLVRAPVRGRGRRRWSALAVYLVYAAQVEWMLGRIGRFGRGTGLAYPVPLVAFVALFARSLALAAVRGRVGWKGRTLALPAAGPVRRPRP